MGGYSNTFKKSLRLTSALGMSMFSAVLPMMVGNSIPLMVCSVLLSCGASYNLGNTLINVLVGRSLSSKEKERIDQALEDLKTIPFMQPIIQNLPEDIKYVVDISGRRDGFCNSALNTIGIDEELLNDTTAQGKLAFYGTLAHELGHANQYKEGLSENDLISPSFGDTVRVDRMGEAEAWLVGVMAENELLKRPEFCECPPSASCQYYRKELDRAGGDVSKANTAFVLSYWKNSLNNPLLDYPEKEDINSWNFYYTMQGYRNSYFSKSRKKNSSKKARTALEVMGLYAQRIGLTGVAPEQFLEDGFDGLHIGKTLIDGIRMVNVGGNSDEELVITQEKQPQRYKGRLLVKGEDKATFSINRNAEVRVCEENDTYLKYLAGLVWLSRWSKKKKTAPLEITPDGKVKFPFCFKGGWRSNLFEDGKYDMVFNVLDADGKSKPQADQIDLFEKGTFFSFSDEENGLYLMFDCNKDGTLRVDFLGKDKPFGKTYTREEFTESGIAQLQEFVKNFCEFSTPAKKRKYEDYSLRWLENVRNSR